jgi:putative oxidoreductase
MSYGLLLLRVVGGLTISAHGVQKLFGWFGGHGVRGTAGFFDNLGFRPPVLLAVLAGLGETGGVLFAAGFLTPLAALGMTIVMFNAIAVVHWSKGFFNGNGGLEFPLTLATIAVSVSMIGPGRFSIDRAIGWDDNISGLWWGVGVAVAAAAITLLTVATTRRRARVQAAAPA